MNSLTADGLGKCYMIGGSPTAFDTAGNFLRKLNARLRRTEPAAGKIKAPREFWALRHVTFAVQPGTVLGVIGANGAGKSTLLKILAKVTPPTEGRVVGVGRVVSLLELGAGFNPDASARENIFMNAAMLGIPRHDVVRRFDHIIEFAELGEFIDTPLKHFSSGMYLRLAFSTAVNMEPDLLLADEILAVGDLAFQERCLSKVMELSREGLTVLFVSHDMEAVSRICSRVLWINKGEVVKLGEPDEVITEYQNAAWAKADINFKSGKGRFSNRHGQILAVRLTTTSGNDVGGAPIEEDVFVKIRYQLTRGGVRVRAGFDLHTRGLQLFRSVDTDVQTFDEPGIYEALGRIPAHFLAEAMYVVHANITIFADEKENSLVIFNALTFMAYPVERKGGSIAREGVIAPRLEWTTRREAPVAAG
jgi:lipopolysaccharide transport system ATP-binding protein